jgi:hypothetical protein
LFCTSFVICTRSPELKPLSGQPASHSPVCFSLPHISNWDIELQSFKVSIRINDRFIGRSWSFVMCLQNSYLLQWCQVLVLQFSLYLRNTCDLKQDTDVACHVFILCPNQTSQQEAFCKSSPSCFSRVAFATCKWTGGTNYHKLVAEDHAHIKQVLIGSHCFLTPAQPSPTQVLRSIVWLCHQPEPNGKETFCSGLCRDCRDIVPVNMCRLVLGWPHLALEFAFFRLAMKGKPVTTCEAAMPDCQTDQFLPVPSEVLPPPVLSGSCSSIEPVPAQCDLKQNWRMWHVMYSSFFQSNQHNKKPSASLLQAASPG